MQYSVCILYNDLVIFFTMNDLVVIKTGGKQYVIKKDDVIEIELIKDLKANDSITFNEVLLTKKGDNVVVGTPYVDKAEVKATVLREIKGPKINILKFKAKSRYRRHVGHRQNYLQVKIDKV